LHLAVYATLTRAFDRYATLAAAGREFLLVCTVLSAVLLWATARRLRLGPVASAVAALLGGAALLFSPITAPDSPVRIAVPWLLLAAWLLARGAPSLGSMALALLSATVAVLLAPGTLLLLLAGTVAAAITGQLPRHVQDAGRRFLAGGAALLFVVVTFLLGGWDPAPGNAAGWALPEPEVVVVAAGLLTIGGLAAWRLPRFRALAVGLVTTTAVAVGLPGGRSALHICLPLAALLTAALLQALARSAVRGRVRLRRIARVAAALVLTGAAVAALVALVRAPRPDLGARNHAALLSWVRGQLSEDAQLTAPARPWAEAVHAGGDEDQFLLPGTAGPGSPLAPVVRVTEGGGRLDLLVARFGASNSAPPLTVVDPARQAPSPEDLERRLSLARALLVNPTTTAGPQAARVLESGQVDPRLLTLLAALAAQFGVGVESLPPVPGESLRHTPAREAVVDSLGGEPLTPGAPVTNRLLAYLAAQMPPFDPDRVEAGTEGVRVAFHYVSTPDALVTGSTP
jgi:hypothetical protein